MKIREAEPLKAHTTFKIGGPAAFYAELDGAEDVREAAALARERGLPLRLIGEGSNLLVPDEGAAAVVARLAPRDVRIEGEMLFASAGALWDAVVDAASGEGLWGIENLAGIPGTVGGAVVQNIGAYGAELSETCAYVEACDLSTGLVGRVGREDAGFAYRMSAFKDSRRLAVLGAAFTLSRRGAPRLGYQDLQSAAAAGESLGTPSEVACAVRAIRMRKFPDLSKEGTAGSFFKNPVVSSARTEELLARYPELPHFPQDGGAAKISLAWILDHALSLKGHAVGGARLFERQPLVIATDATATARDVESLAEEIAERVRAATGITIEREVETFMR